MCHHFQNQLVSQEYDFFFCKKLSDSQIFTTKKKKSGILHGKGIILNPSNFQGNDIFPLSRDEPLSALLFSLGVKITQSFPSSTRKPNSQLL